MKLPIASLTLLTICCLVLAVTPAMADTLYSNGPYNGTVDAWTINFGFSVSDAARVNSELENVTGFSMVDWNDPGDVTTGAEIQFGATSFGNNYADLTLAPSGSTDLGSNQFGYELWQYDFTFANVAVPGPGTVWVTLSNATSAAGNPVYWDENSGPSSAYENSVGSIPSEAFTLTGTSSGTTPEPSSIMLFGSGIIGLAGVLRRKLNI